MINSRKDGKLFVATNRPYRVSSEGKYVEKSIVCCREFKNDQEWLAVGLYQMAMAAIMSSPITKDEAIQKMAPKNQETEDISEIESPSQKQVEEIGNGYKMFLMTNPNIDLTNFMIKFEGLVTTGYIQTDTEKPIGLADWRDGVRWDDKLKIACCYVGFFVQPSQSA